MLYSVLTGHIATVAATKALCCNRNDSGFIMISDDLKAKLEDLVRQEIKSGEIVNFFVSEYDSFDGGSDGINLKVVYDSKSKRLDPRELAGITTKARKILLENGSEFFPIFNFILKSEAGGLIAAE